MTRWQTNSSARFNSMKERNTHLITIGYAKQALVRGSREHKRMLAYTEMLGSLHVVVFTRREEGFQEPVREGKLSVYPTNSLARPLMLLDALLLGWRIVSTGRECSWIVSSQDPFEASFVGRILAFLRRLPHHVQLHGDNFSDNEWRSASLLNRFRYRWGLHVLRHASAIRVASERIRQSLIALGIKTSCITVLPIRPELERFLSMSHEAGDHDPFVFLAASRFSKEKDIPRMVRAFKEISGAFPRARLRLVGQGREEKTIRGLIDALGIQERVDIIPWTEAIEKEMEQADVFLLASRHEAYALTLVEAMAVGLPVITTDVGCVGEVVKDGVHGLVVREAGVASYAAAMTHMLENDEFRMRCSKNGRETAHKLAMQSEPEYVKAWVTAVSRASERV